ncbi:uncharacterized protein LOC109863139, partial [Pseudomyrmex gracilis]|uniref:uncharacterized protein LOC109863139 n=1 Tax=Pseudomyrmex gracilis TaxID=219809 RepID=UPI00099593BF
MVNNRNKVTANEEEAAPTSSRFASCQQQQVASVSPRVEAAIARVLPMQRPAPRAQRRRREGSEEANKPPLRRARRDEAELSPPPSPPVDSDDEVQMVLEVRYPPGTLPDHFQQKETEEEQRQWAVEELRRRRLEAQMEDERYERETVRLLSEIENEIIADNTDNNGVADENDDDDNDDDEDADDNNDAGNDDDDDYDNDDDEDADDNNDADDKNDDDDDDYDDDEDADDNNDADDENDDTDDDGEDERLVIISETEDSIVKISEGEVQYGGGTVNVAQENSSKQDGTNNERSDDTVERYTGSSSP